jgi:hypothetical protein
MPLTVSGNAAHLANFNLFCCRPEPKQRIGMTGKTQNHEDTKARRFVEKTAFTPWRLRGSIF